MPAISRIIATDSTVDVENFILGRNNDKVTISAMPTGSISYIDGGNGVDTANDNARERCLVRKVA